MGSDVGFPIWITAKYLYVKADLIHKLGYLMEDLPFGTTL